MPDTFTHIALPYILKNKIKHQIFYISLLIGSVLPDYFREFFSLILPQDYFGFVIQFHSIISGIAISILISALFKKQQRTKIFFGIFSGYILHLSFDLLQGYPCGSQIYVLLPFLNALNIGLVQEADWIYIFAGSFIVFLVYLMWQGISFIRKRENKNLRN
jgi:hypothetical protein